MTPACPEAPVLAAGDGVVAAVDRDPDGWQTLDTTWSCLAAAVLGCDATLACTAAIQLLVWEVGRIDEIAPSLRDVARWQARRSNLGTAELGRTVEARIWAP